MHSLLESCEILPGDLQYTVEMIPVVKLEGCGPEGCDKYCVDAKDFQRMLNSEHMEISDGIHALIHQISKDTGEDVTDACDLAIVAKKQDVCDLDEMIKKDPKKLKARCESVAKHVDFLTAVKEAGCEIYLTR